MAKQEGMWINGRFGQVVFYTMGDKHIARSIPSKVQRTKNMKLRNENFGKASSLAAAFRKALAGAIPDPKSLKMQTGFTGAFSNWLQTTRADQLASSEDLSFVNGFYFAQGKPAWELWLERISVQHATHQTSVHIPALNPSMLPAASTGPDKFTVIIAAANVDFKTGLCSKEFNQQSAFELPVADNEAMEIVIPFSTLAGNICLVAAAVEFSYSPTHGNKKILPPVSRIVGASYKQ